VQAARFPDHVAHFGQEKFLLRRREWNGRVERGEAHDWAVEVVEGVFVDDGGDFSGEASGARVLVKNNDFVGLLHGGDDCLAIERRDGAQVDDFQIDSFFAEDFRGFERCVQHGCVGDDA